MALANSLPFKFERHEVEPKQHYRLDGVDKKLIKLIKKFIKDENISDTGNSRITSDDYFSGFIESLEQK